jgi:tubby-related protein 1
MNASTLAAKMREQREKQLEKQRARSMMAMGPSVVQPASGLSRGAHLADGDSMKDPLSQAPSRASTAESSSFGAALPPPPQMGDDDEDGPAVVPAHATEESASELLEKMGIKAQYDPQPQCVSRGGRGVVDLESLGEPEMIDFLLNPVPRAMGVIECRIVREKSGLNMLYPKYTLKTEMGTLLLTAKKRVKNRTSNYALMRNHNAKFDKDDESYVAKLRGNFVGSEFILYGRGMNPNKIPKQMSLGQKVASVRPELCGISYTNTVWAKKQRGPRRMKVALPKVGKLGDVKESRPLTEEGQLLPVLRSVSDADAPGPQVEAESDVADLYQNKQPKWNDQIGAFVLNFNKRVSTASVKNFQLVNHSDPDVVYLQFGRAGKDSFTMDVRYPMSIVQAFGIVLSSFDYKLCCE